MDGMKELELATINNGAAEELFQRELNQVLQNIDDPSTDAKESRKITIEICFDPNESRDQGQISIKAKSKLAPAKATGSVFMVRSNGRKSFALEPNTYQPGFDFDNVKDFKSASAGERDED